MINAYNTSGTSPTTRKPKTLKVVTINAQFPELKDGATHQIGKGRGSSLRVAFAAAGRNLFSQPRLRRKRFTQFSITATVGTEAA
jgi:hypothetical protein